MDPLDSLAPHLSMAAAAVDGDTGICVCDIATGREIGHCADERFPLASVCKVPILVEAFRRYEAGQLDLDERIPFTEEKRCFGSGLLSAMHPGLRLTVYDLLVLMITVSDNAATDMVLDRLTPGAVTATMRRLGLAEIRVDRRLRELLGDYLKALDPSLADISISDWERIRRRRPELDTLINDVDAAREATNRAAGNRDVASPRAMARLLAMIAQSQCAGEDACRAMLDIMDRQQLNGRLPHRFPANTRFPHKTGTLGHGAVVNDAGILYIDGAPAAAIAAFTRNVRSPIFVTEEALAQLGRAVYDAYTSA